RRSEAAAAARPRALRPPRRRPAHGTADHRPARGSRRSSAGSSRAKPPASIARAACRPSRGDRAPRRSGACLPDLALHVPLRPNQDVDQGAVVEIAVVEVRRDAALVERAPLLDLLAEVVEEAVVLEAL